MTSANSRRRAAERRGRWAEALVAAHYWMRGFSVVERRFRARGGEIDLIARRGRLLVFCEVKGRRDVDAAIHAVTPRNRRRFETAGRTYLAGARRYGDFAIRYDIAAVAGWRVEIIADAWREGE